MVQFSSSNSSDQTQREAHRTSKPAICKASVSAATMTDILESSYRRTQSQPIGGMVVAIATFRLDLSRTTKNTTIKTSDNYSTAHTTVSGFTENKTI